MQKSYNIIGDACYVDPDATMQEALSELLSLTEGTLISVCPHFAQIQYAGVKVELWSTFPEPLCSCAGQPVEETTPCPYCGIPRCFPPEADCEIGSFHTFPQPTKRPETEEEVAAVRADLERLPGFQRIR